MYRINKRFFIYLIAINALMSPLFITKHIVAGIVTYSIVNFLYVTLWVVMIIAMNNKEKANEEFVKKYGEENLMDLTFEEVEQFKREGALYKDGKSLIDGEGEMWKEMEVKQRRK